MSREEELQRELQRIFDKAIDGMAACSELWDGDTINDELARAVIAGLRPLAEALFRAANTEHVNKHVFMIAARQYTQLAMNARELNLLGQLRK